MEMDEGLVCSKSWWMILFCYFVVVLFIFFVIFVLV